jgi:hypothetical protein
MDREPLAVLTELARAQHGVFGREQALVAGVDRGRLFRATRSGLLVRVHPSVYRFAAVPDGWRSRVWAAYLQAGPDAVVSHESALRLRGVDGVAFRVAVTVPPGRRAAHEGIRVHRFGDLVAEHWDLLDGLPVTSLERTVVDMASELGRRRLDWLLDRLTITERRTTVGAVARVLRQVERRGRRRIAVLGALLDARRPAEPSPRSRVERRIDELLAGSGLPSPAKEYPLPGWPPGSGFVDRAWPEARLILEVDGRSWHAREASMARDRARDRAAAAEGWQTIRVLDAEVADIPDAVLRDVVRVHVSRTARQLS